MTDRLIGRRYEQRQQIGVGGMATVYLGYDHREGREVAVKVLDSRYAADPAFVERFRREARSAAALDHPNIVRVHDWGEDSESDPPLHYIVMEYVPGPNLKELLREQGPLPQVEALGIVTQIAEALDAAHGQGIVHRDVKPHNVLLGPDGRVKVADFGIARAVGASQLTSTTTVLGSVHYVAPEQAQGKPTDGRSDIYSLGVLLYELLTGALPFGGDSPVAVAMQHVHKSAPSPRLIQPSISPRVEAIVLRTLAKDPARRFQTVSELRVAVESARRDLVHDVTGATQPLPNSATTGMEPVAEKQPQRQASVPASLRWPGMALLALATLALLFLLAGFPTSAQPTTVAVPNVTGKTLAEAQEVLGRVGLRLEVRQRLHNRVPADTVLAQDPSPGAIAPHDSAVQVDISLGPAAATPSPTATPTPRAATSATAPRSPQHSDDDADDKQEELTEAAKEADKKAAERQREAEEKAEEKQREAEKKAAERQREVEKKAAERGRGR